MSNKDYPSSTKPFENVFVKLTYEGHSLGTLFNDFLEMTVAEISGQSVHRNEISKRYKQEELMLFSQAFSELVEIMDKSCLESGKYVAEDYLGEFFMRFITYGEHGQYFTPQNICDMMAQMQTPPEGESKYRVLDPAAGSGRMGLAVAKQFGKRKVMLTLCDLDRRCCLIAVINLLLNAIDGEVYQCNSLSMEMFDGRKIGLQYGTLPYIDKINVAEMPEEKKELILKHKPTEKTNLIPMQTSLF